MVQLQKRTFVMLITQSFGKKEVPTVVGPNMVQLQLVLERCKYWSVEKRTMVRLLCVLHLAVYGIASSRHILVEESTFPIPIPLFL